jgi:hypothetical protein
VLGNVVLRSWSGRDALERGRVKARDRLPVARFRVKDIERLRFRVEWPTRGSHIPEGDDGSRSATDPLDLHDAQMR